MKFLLVFVFFAGACSSIEQREAQGPERSLYERGLRALSDEEYKESQEFFAKLLQQYPTTRWLPSAYYNWGQALEGAELYEAAAEKYKKVIDHFNNLHNKEEAEAIYRLSICYEVLGQDDKLVVALLQLKPLLHFFGPEVKDSEWPSRMAAAYARMELPEQAKVYYDQAEAALKKLKNIKSKDAKNWLPKTYYTMGRLPAYRLKFKTVPEFKTMMTSLEVSEIWLLKAIEYRMPPWNEKARAELMNAYQKSWEFIDKLPAESGGDKLIALKKKQELQKMLATRLDTVLSKLKAERDHEFEEIIETEDKVLFQFNKELLDFQKSLDVLISQREVQDQDTIESKKLQGPRIDGKLVP